MDLFKPMLYFFNRAIAFPLISLIYIYRYTLSPIFVNRCRFHPTCSAYALQALKTKNIFTSIVLIVKRLSKCHPYHSGGFDPVK